jgi:hypothetical protein
MDLKKAIKEGKDAEIAKGVSKMSSKELEQLSGIKEGVESLVRNLSPQQFEALMKSDKLDDIQKGRIQTARYQPLSAAIKMPVGAAKDTAIRNALNAMSKGELQGMPAGMLSYTDVLRLLTEKQRDTITESSNDKRTAAEKDLVRNASPVGSIEAAFVAAGGGAAGAAAVVADPNFVKLSAPQFTKLDRDILKQPAVYMKFAAATLAELAKENKLSPADMKVIGTAIQGDPTAPGHNYITSTPGGALWL